MQELHDTVPAPGRIGLDLIAIQKDAPVELDLRLSSDNTVLVGLRVNP